MIWLILSIACSTIIVFIFRLFSTYKVHTFQAIVVNYIVCTVLGLLVEPPDAAISNIFSEPWFGFSILLGCIFISLFFIIAITAQKSGITIATVAMKLGMVAPVVIGILVFNESSSIMKISGVAFAIVAVVLTSYKEKAPLAISRKERLIVILPFIVFLGSGLADSIVQYVEHSYFSNGGFEFFIIILFGTAASIGLLATIFLLITAKAQFNIKNVIAGIILGIPNYGSIYFLFKTLNESAMESSIIFPLNNIGIVSVASIGALLLFREKLNWVNGLGLLATFVSILLISMS